MEFTSLTASAAAVAVRHGDVSALELVEACLAQIAAREPDVQAWVYLDPEAARAQARDADTKLKEGKGVGPLHGVPVGIKDIIDTADMPTENGSPAFKGHQPERDAAVVAALRAAGAVIMGKTVTTELATLTPGKTRNPHNTKHTPGGSSSGSAAAVAAGMVPAALGTQTAGSVIRPAAFCGIYGFKPTYGTIPRKGVLMQAQSLDTIGVYGRSVEDLALLTDVLAAPDPDDPGAYAGVRPKIAAIASERAPIAPMFALISTNPWLEAEPVTREAFGELREQLGDKCVEIDLTHTFDDAGAHARTVQRVEMAFNYGPLLDRTPDMISPRLRSEIEEGRTISGPAYLAARAACARLYRSAEDLFLSYGTIVTPAAPGPAPEGLATGNPVFCAAWTYLGVPCVTLPLLEADGLPIGVQLIGARRDDGRLLRTARWLVEFSA